MNDPPAIPAAAGPAAGVALRGLTIRAAGRTLLEEAGADFPAGKITLVIGASGAGKSVLLRLLAGLLRPGESGFEISGGVRIEGWDRFQGDAGISVGIVFQNFALFDEFSALGNVLFGFDHRRRHERRGEPPPDSPEPTASAAGRLETARGLLDELGIPAAVPVSLLSGGQKQRLAIARTLAFDPQVVVYDEPTSGLDPANARRVAERISNTQKLHSKTTVIVTHDYENLAGIADAIFLLDHREKNLRRVPPEALGEAAMAMAGAPEKETAPEGVGLPAPPSARKAMGRAIGLLGDFFAATACAGEACIGSMVRLLPWWRSPRWGLRYLLHYLSLIASPSSLAYFGAAGLIAGFVSTHFTFKFLPFKAYTEPLITEELLQGLGFSLYRIVVPVLLTVLLAARCGAAISADLGSRVYNRQIDAMRSLSARPENYLLTNILHAFILATPLLLLLGFWVARLTSLIVFSYNYPRHNPLFWDGHFHRSLRVPGQLLYHGTGWMLCKVLACGLGTGMIAYFQGMKPKLSGVDVSRAITRTIIWATLFVLLVHFAFAFLEF
ncbi:MAG: ABC transporter permease [Planctomycetes bacterium]|nr:ABC transporter permease [Planctomycetota bacterium]